ncbi:MULTISPECIES: hypothetical protein [unclassified Methylobacterium]|jgi:hypothetical protein|uniref:hypothetical protein n=1 Tax=unclassified Methylobacterium TaxID=2615210 RepID=UPI001354E575|nr:hypothetical protein [Methylobacterium sp. 2A]MWV25209.1 hypothetical protein [Methylobacterium sp. 2A]
MTLHEQIEKEIMQWIKEFIVVPNEFYDGKFAPCPYAHAALLARAVDVAVWRSGDPRHFIREQASTMRDSAGIQTRVIVFPPRVQWSLGISDFVDTLNTELIPGDTFLNTGVAKTTNSLYPGSAGQPYFIVVVNSLAAVLRGAKSLQKTNYYDKWPAAHRRIVVDRRADLAERYKQSKDTRI